MSEWRRQANRTRKDGPHKAVVEALRAVGCSVYVGGPLDAVVSCGPVTWLLEIKRLGGKLTPAQVKFLEGWQGRTAIVYTADEALQVAAQMRARQ